MSGFGAGKAALVTGAAGGLGLAVARMLAEEGYKVAMGDLPGDKLRTATAAVGPAAHGFGALPVGPGRGDRRFRTPGGGAFGAPVNFTGRGPFRLPGSHRVGRTRGRASKGSKSSRCRAGAGRGCGPAVAGAARGWDTFGRGDGGSGRVCSHFTSVWRRFLTFEG